MKTVAAAVLAAAVGFRVLAQTAQPDAAALLAEARSALGGDAALAAIHSFRIEGEFSAPIPTGRVVTNPIEFEFVAPDKFVRIRHAGSLGGGPMPPFRTTDYAGFNGNEPIQAHQVVGNPPMPTFFSMEPEPKTPADVAAVHLRLLTLYKREFVKIFLPLFAASPAADPLTVESVGRDQSADVITFRTPDGVRWNLMVDGASRLPAKLTWMETAPFVVSTTSTVAVTPNGRVVGAGTSGPSRAPASTQPVLWELFFSDYRMVDGVKWPHLFTTMVGGVRGEAWRFSKIRINDKLNEKDFVPRVRHDN